VVKYLCWLGRRSRPDLPDTASRRTILKAAFDAIEAHEIALGSRLLYGTGGLPGLLTHKSVTIYGDKSASDKREAVYAFSIDGLGTKEAVRGFVQRNVIVHDRVSDAYSGHTLARLGIDAVTRVSLAHYNTIEEVDHFLFALNEIIRDVVTYDA
jgi:selenocysteine lyase/cysteine desulfurase